MLSSFDAFVELLRVEYAQGSKVVIIEVPSGIEDRFADTEERCPAAGPP